MAGAYRQLNAWLRTGDSHAVDEERGSHVMPESKLRRYQKDIDGAFAAAKPTTQPMVVYRGMSGVIPADVKPGQVLHDKAYMSTGTDPEGVGTYTWDASGNEKIPAVRITVPAGTKAISQYKRAGGPGMESWTNQNREREVLLPRDSRIKVTGKDPDGTITAELQ